MPHKPLPRRPNSSEREEREQKLKAFIEGNLVHGSDAGGAAILLLARSGNSVAARVVGALSPRLAAMGLAAQIVLTTTASAGDGEAEAAAAASVVAVQFEHEIRVVDDTRILDGHEQLVVGSTGVWFGDCMRREPDKRDCFEWFQENDPAAVRTARQTFAALWQTAEPYIVQGPPTPRGEADDAIPPPAAQVDGVAATLEAWRPSTRH